MALSRTFPWFVKRPVQPITSAEVEVGHSKKRLQIQIQVQSELHEFCRTPRQVLRVVETDLP